MFPRSYIFILSTLFSAFQMNAKLIAQTTIIRSCEDQVLIPFAKIEDARGEKRLSNKKGECYLNGLKLPLTISGYGYDTLLMNIFEKEVCLHQQFQELKSVKVGVTDNWKLFDNRLSKSKKRLLNPDANYATVNQVMCMYDYESNDTLTIQKTYSVKIVNTKKEFEVSGRIDDYQYYKSKGELTKKDSHNIQLLEIWSDKEKLFEFAFHKKANPKLSKSKFELFRAVNVKDTFIFTKNQYKSGKEYAANYSDSILVLFQNNNLEFWKYEEGIQEEASSKLNDKMLRNYQCYYQLDAEGG